MAITDVDKLRFLGRLRELSAGLLDEARDECWPWPGGTSGENNYGRFYLANGKSCYVHRFAWEIEHGEIPPGMVVRHTCDNTICFRGKHLLVGTQLENQQDKARRRRAIHPARPFQGLIQPIKSGGSANGNSYLTEQNVRDIRSAWEESNVTREELAAEYKTTSKNIGQIIRRRTWRHI